MPGYRAERRCIPHVLACGVFSHRNNDLDAPGYLASNSNPKRKRGAGSGLRGNAMAITCPRCGAGFDVTLFQFGHKVQCDCGQWVSLDSGHLSADVAPPMEIGKMAEEEIGKITHYFGNISVAAVEITSGSLSVGDTIHVKGHTSDFKQTIESMQMDGQSVDGAGVGQAVGFKVLQHARVHDTVYKVSD